MHAFRLASSCFVGALALASLAPAAESASAPAKKLGSAVWDWNKFAVQTKDNGARRDVDTPGLTFGLEHFLDLG